MPNIQLSRFQIYLFFCLLGCQNSGYYGEDCSLQCPPNCQEGYCSIVDGTCLGCRVGYRGPNCDDRECLVTIVKDFLTIQTLHNYILTTTYFLLMISLGHGLFNFYLNKSKLWTFRHEIIITKSICFLQLIFKKHSWLSNQQLHLRTSK